MNEQSKGMSMEEKTAFDAKKKAAADAYQQRKVDARLVITTYLEKDETIPKNVREAILYISGTGVRSARSGINAELRALFIEKKTVSSVDLFQKFEYGRPTMNQKIKLFINAPDPEDRIWIAFESGNYVLKGKGAVAPRGWTGFIPTEKEDI